MIRIHRGTKKTILTLIFVKNNRFGTMAQALIICFLKYHQLHLSHKILIPTESACNLSMCTLLFASLTKNASLKSYGTFTYLLPDHIHNINMRMYIINASKRGFRHTHNCNRHAWGELADVNIVPPLSETTDCFKVISI